MFEPRGERRKLIININENIILGYDAIADI